MNWRTIGDVSYDIWHDVVTDAGGPAGLASEASFEAAKPHSALILAMAGRECHWGTTENLNKLSNRNVLNRKPPLQPDGSRKSGFMAFTTWDAGIKAARVRITSSTYGNGIYVPTKDVFDLISVFAPASENDVQGYVDFVEDHVGAWETIATPTEPTPGGGTVPGTFTKDQVYILIDAGHRSTDRSGNPAEMDRTDEMSEQYVAEHRGRGYR
jgi:hypothetical protein